MLVMLAVFGVEYVGVCDEVEEMACGVRLRSIAGRGRELGRLGGVKRSSEVRGEDEVENRRGKGIEGGLSHISWPDT